MGFDAADVCVPRLTEGRGTFRLFTEGDELYDTMVGAIERARERVRLELYIFAADEVGRRFARALVARARAGVEVRVHLDAVGAAFRPLAAVARELVEAGVRLRWYQPWSWRRPFRYARRTHRKLLVVDDEEAFLGGFNIDRENSRALEGEGRTRDTHVAVRGELARLAAALFDRLWDGRPPPDAGAIPDDASPLEALLVPNASRRCQQRLVCLHAGLIAAARRSVYVTTPYFCPGTLVDEALQAAARRGVDARLLVPRMSDPSILGWVTRAAYEGLLAAGVRVFEYLPRKLHAKTSVVDDQWSVIGSANLDHLSLFVNHELVLLAREPALALALREAYRRDLVEAEEVRLTAWRHRGWRERGLEALGRTFRRLL